MAGEGEGRIINSDKQVAKDGSQRGLHRRGTKNKAAVLMEQMQKVVEEKFGVANFDPVVMMALIGMQAMQDREVRDPDTGEIKQIVLADVNLALSAFAKVAPYVRQQLKTLELTGEGGGPIQVSTVDAKARLAAMIGLTVEAEAEVIEEEE